MQSTSHVDVDLVGKRLDDAKQWLDKNQLQYNIDITLAPHYQVEQQETFMVIRQHIHADGKYYLVCGVKMGKEVPINNGL